MNSARKARRDQTNAIHGGEEHQPTAKPITTPIYTTATYRFESTKDLRSYLSGDQEAFHYTRYGNPTVRVAEKKLAAIEGAQDALLLSSGMCALSTTFLSMLKAGQHVVFTSDSYRPTVELLSGLLRRFGVESDRVPIGDMDALQNAIRPGQTRIIFSELTTNPHNRVIDIERLVDIKKKARACLVIDATLSSPYNVQPLAHGADIVVHSVTKYLAGHNDLIAGAILCKSAVAEAFREQRALLGGILAPETAYRIIRGLKTYPLRMERHNKNALRVAQWLDAHPRVQRVFYPMLESHPDHALAQKILRGGGGVVTFLLDGDLQYSSNFIDHLKLIIHSASLGGTESLIQQPAIFSHSDMSAEQRADEGILDNLLRLSVGLEDVEDILEDLEQAFNAL